MNAKQKAMSLYGFTEWPSTHIRHKAAADCRTYACLLLRAEGYSLAKTARELGYSDHTAVMWAIKRYDDGKVDCPMIEEKEGAPETIWVKPNGLYTSGKWLHAGEWVDRNLIGYTNAYTRKDISDKRIAELEKEVAVGDESLNLSIGKCIELVATARNEALEEAATVADKEWRQPFLSCSEEVIAQDIGLNIRALKANTTT